MKRSLRVERLVRREEKATVKRIVWLSIVSLVLAVSLFTLGIPALAKFADVLDRVFPNSNQGSGDDDNAPSPPSLDRLPIATNSAKLKLSGFAPGAFEVEIYLESDKVGKVSVEDNKFQFEDLTLAKGNNIVSAKSVSSRGIESDSSQQQKVSFDDEEPKLEVETPTDGQSFSGNNRVIVSGKTDNNSQVYANGFLASVNAEGKFEVFVPVGEGETSIEIRALDEAGNIKSEVRKVNYRK